MSEWEENDEKNEEELEREREEEARRIELERQAAREDAINHMNTYSLLSDQINSVLGEVVEELDSVQQGLDSIQSCMLAYPDSAQGRFVVQFECACRRFQYTEKQLMQYFYDVVDEYRSKLQDISDSYDSWNEQYESNC